MSGSVSPRGGSGKPKAPADLDASKGSKKGSANAKEEPTITPRELTEEERAKRNAANAEKGRGLQKQVPSLDLKDQMTDSTKVKKPSVGATKSPRGYTKRDDDPQASPSLDSAKKSARPEKPKGVAASSSSKYPTARARLETTEVMSDVNLKHHRFMKKQFGHPTWCIFAEKFIWGLEKGGYECRDCKMAISRKFIAEAKNTVCGDTSMALGGAHAPDQSTPAYTKTKVFTVYLPQGNKKSVLLNPMQPLSKELEKICFARNIKMEEYVAMDTNGNPVPLNTLLGKIPGAEITFTQKDPTMSKKRLLPPTFSEVYDKMGLKDKSEAEKERNVGGFGKPGVRNLGGLLNIGKATKRPSNFKKKDSIGGSSTNLDSTDETATTASDELLSPKSKLPVTQRYTIGKELGSGAFSVVYEATENATGETYAIKILDRYEDDDEQAAKFKHEIDMISGLKHDNIVQFIELDQDDEHYYVVMELVKGGELFDQIIEKGGFPSKEAAVIIAQILKALEYMHLEKMAHRDIKPENILFKDSNYDLIKIADFGESKRFLDGPLTTYCGTPDYMAPEIIKGMPYGPAVDMWAMGVIAYVILVGFPPFDGENDVEVFASIMGVRYDFPSPEWDEIEQEAKDFIAAILVESPEERLTASQALQHPWIKKNVPEKFRVNAKPEPAPGSVPQTPIPTSRGEADDSQSGEATERSTGGKSSDKKRKDEHPIKVSVTSPTSVSDSGELAHLDTNDPMVSQKVLDTIMQTQNLARTSLVYMGELVTMEAIVRSIMGDKIESLILPIYWKRLGDIRRVVVSEQAKKKKKK